MVSVTFSGLKVRSENEFRGKIGTQGRDGKQLEVEVANERRKTFESGRES
jgi:hypothetical protein